MRQPKMIKIIALSIAMLSPDTCYFFAKTMDEFSMGASRSDQEIAAIYEAACVATINQEWGTLTQWDCIKNLTPGATMVCEFKWED